MNDKILRKGRTLAITVDDLLDSKRFQIAIRNFNEDPMLMKAILIELGMESMNVAKNTVIKKYALNGSLNQYEMIPLLRSLNTFDTFNIWWSLTPKEVALYQADPKFKMGDLERRILLSEVMNQFMGSPKSKESTSSSSKLR